MSVASNRKLWLGSYDLSGHLQGAAVEIREESVDDTRFGYVSRSAANGIEDFVLQHEGVWSAGTGAPDNAIDDYKGLADVLATWAPVDGDVGSVARIMRVTAPTYELGEKVGELQRFSVGVKASGGAGAVRGYMAVNANLASTDDGTALNLGVLPTGKSLYAGLHVTAADGSSPTLDLIIESDTEEAFGDDPTTRITFTQMTAAGYQWGTPVAGPIADHDWWRASWTIGGSSSPNFDAVVAIGFR